MIDKEPEDGSASEEEDGIIRHYSRERRLSRASPEVRWLVRQYGAKRPGILGSLVATPSLRFIFFSVLLFLAAGGLLSYLTGRQDSGVLGGQLFKVSAFRFGDSLYITLQRSAKSDATLTGSARMTALVNDEQVAAADFFIGAGEREEYRLTAKPPESGSRLKLRIEAGETKLELTTPIR